MAEKEYIKLKRRVVYRGEVYNTLEAKRIKALENISKPYYDGYCDGLKKAIQILANDIEDIPAADVRPVVRGEWWPAKDGYYGHVMCSACHKIESHKTDFCPNCGADMREDS